MGLALALIASIIPMALGGIDDPVGQEGARKIGRVHLERWAGGPIDDPTVEKAGRCWVVWSSAREPSDDAIHEPIAVLIDPRGRLVGSSMLGPHEMRARARTLCLAAVARTGTGRWRNLGAWVPRAPKLRALGCSPRRFGKSVAKLWLGSGEEWWIDDRGTVQKDGHPIGVLAEPIEIPSVRIAARP